MSHAHADKKLVAAIAYREMVLLFNDAAEVFEMRFHNHETVVPTYTVRKLDDLPEAVTRR